MSIDPPRPDGRVWNFSGGPATLPDAALHQLHEELLDWHGTGMSVMEMSHRGEVFMGIAHRAEADFRTLLSIPEDYAVLFLQGGATLQFSAVPLNLAAGNPRADYMLTGAWSAKAVEEASRHLSVNLAVDTRDEGHDHLPGPSTWRLDPDAAYLHYTPNETIHGVEFHDIPDTGDVPLVADASSTILSRPLDIARFGMVYAGAQKNIGPAGLCVVIIRHDLVGKAGPRTPAMLDYANHFSTDSMFNTPPTLAWYIAGLVFQWVLREGGLEEMAARNRRKSGKLYAAIDASGFYYNPVATDARSWMNIPFTLADPALDATFLQEAGAAGLANLAGHRAVGGMRASLYNAMPEAGVDALVSFMHDFERRHG